MIGWRQIQDAAGVEPCTPWSRESKDFAQDEYVEIDAFKSRFKKQKQITSDWMSLEVISVRGGSRHPRGAPPLLNRSTGRKNGIIEGEKVKWCSGYHPFFNRAGLALQYISPCWAEKHQFILFVASQSTNSSVHPQHEGTSFAMKPNDNLFHLASEPFKEILSNILIETKIESIPQIVNLFLIHSEDTNWSF